MKLHTSPLQRHLTVAIDRLHRDVLYLKLYLSGLPPARRKYIIYLFIICHDSELPYCCWKQWHLGVLPRRHTIENFVKLGQTACKGCQRGWKRKALHQRDREHDAVPMGWQITQCWVTMTGYWAWLCLHFVLIAALCHLFHFCFYAFIIFPICRIVGSFTH